MRCGKTQIMTACSHSGLAWTGQQQAHACAPQLMRGLLACRPTRTILLWHTYDRAEIVHQQNHHASAVLPASRHVAFLYMTLLSVKAPRVHNAVWCFPNGLARLHEVRVP